VRASILELGDLSEQDIGKWRALAAEASEPNPFFEPEYVLSAAERLGGRHLGVAAVEGPGGWSACVPVHRPRRWHRVPFGCVATWQHKYCFLGTPLVRPGVEEAAVTALIRELTRRPRIAFVGFDLLADEGPVREALRRAIAGEGGGEVLVSGYERAVLRRGDNGSGPGGVKGKHRRELDRKRRRLEDELGRPLQTIDRAGDEGAVDDFLELEASGWKGRGGTAVASHQADAEFFRAVCRAFRRLGRLRLLSLQTADRRVAMACNVTAQEGVFCLKIAFDERWRRFSPGAQLVVDHVAWLERERGVAWMDSCVQPENELVNRLWPDRRRIVTLAVPAGSASGRLARAAIAGAVRLREARGGGAQRAAA
jgi:CelD/BcsL family acetyltransferase involved in cellulose biosynthesis